MVRRLLDRTYLAAGVLACVFLASIAALVVVQVVSRLFGVLISGLIDYATYAMVASTFLGLALALKRGTHIRVTLLLHNLPPRPRRLLEIVSLLTGAAILGYFAWFATQLALDSWRYGLLSMGLAATPLWIPQAGMALGGLIGAICFLDELLRVVSGRPPSYQGLEESAAAAADGALLTPALMDAPAPAERPAGERERRGGA